VVAPLVAGAVLLGVFLVVERLSSEPMLDLGLLRVPTFGGGLVAAWALSASAFAIITYLVIYLQNSLGLSAVATGVRFLPFTGAIFVTAGIAGRLTTHVPRRALIAAGFVLSGIGFLLMRGLAASSGWTHLLAGMIVGGVGAGLVSTPLVSTAVGVVEPARAGMASGINTTLRQVGIATGVAGLGTILASQERGSIVHHLTGTPLAPHAHALAHAISTGGAHDAIAGAPAPLRGLVAGTARVGLVHGLNTILLISAIVAFAAAAASLVLIRERDFVTIEDEEGNEQPQLAVAA
jgi:predicted MFS family arabinose efflux permease